MSDLTVSCSSGRPGEPEVKHKSSSRIRTEEQSLGRHVGFSMHAGTGENAPEKADFRAVCIAGWCAVPAKRCREEDEGRCGPAPEREMALEAGKPVLEDERICRYCLGGEEECPEQGPLISPCKCRGDQRYFCNPKAISAICHRRLACAVQVGSHRMLKAMAALGIGAAANTPSTAARFCLLCLRAQHPRWTVMGA
jgi:hypothetical protein